MEGSRSKGGLKLHTMRCLQWSTGFRGNDKARVYDLKFLNHLKLESDSWEVFEKALNIYSQFEKWKHHRVWFVTRMKDNPIYHVTKVMVDNTQKKYAQGVLKDQYVTFGFKTEKSDEQRLKHRRIIYKTDKDGRVYYFITNDSYQPAEEISMIYKNRWMIVLLL
jgi:hypothetical protein